MTELTGTLPTSLASSEERLTDLLRSLPLTRHRHLQEEILSLGGRIYFEGGKQMVEFDPMRLLSRADPNAAFGAGADLIRDMEAKLKDVIERYS